MEDALGGAREQEKDVQAKCDQLLSDERFRYSQLEKELQDEKAAFALVKKQMMDFNQQLQGELVEKQNLMKEVEKKNELAVQ